MREHDEKIRGQVGTPGTASTYAAFRVPIGPGWLGTIVDILPAPWCMSPAPPACPHREGALKPLCCKVSPMPPIVPT